MSFKKVLLFAISAVLSVSADVSVSIKDGSHPNGYASNLSLPGEFFQKRCRDGKKCVPYHQCPDSDGAGIFNVRTNTLEEEYLPCETLQVCCELSAIVTKVPKFNVAKTCGIRNSEGLGVYAIGNDNEAQFGEFPWMMAILKKETVIRQSVLIYTAGGSLITPSIVLTTAHNLIDSHPTKYVVRGGEWNTQSTDEVLPHQERDVVDIVFHKNFTRKNLQNDIALVFIDEPFKLSAHINTICLPEADYDTSNQNCTVSGWGKTKFGKTVNYQVFLKKIELPIVDNDECQERLRKTRLGEDFKLHSGFMCAGGEPGIDACTGDGGSPLVCKAPSESHEDFYYQAGIVVGGIGCGGDFPAFYADVQKYKPWIDEQIALKESRK